MVDDLDGPSAGELAAVLCAENDAREAYDEATAKVNLLAAKAWKAIEAEWTSVQ